MAELKFADIVDIIQKACKALPPDYTIWFTHDYVGHVVKFIIPSIQLSMDVQQDPSSKQWSINAASKAKHAVSEAKFMEILHAKLKLFPTSTKFTGTPFEKAVTESRNTFNMLLSNVYVYKKCVLIFDPTNANEIQLYAETFSKAIEGIKKISIKCTEDGKYTIQGKETSLDSFESLLLQHLKIFQRNVNEIAESLYNDPCAFACRLSFDNNNDNIVVIRTDSNRLLCTIHFKQIRTLCSSGRYSLSDPGSEMSQECLDYEGIKRNLIEAGLMHRIVSEEELRGGHWHALMKITDLLERMINIA